MILGIFGLPGAAELLIIALVAVAIFAPSLLLFWLGWVLGQRSALKAGGEAPAPGPGEAPGDDGDV